ncbi:hypothetical protein C7M84_006257 [Penaeus vannamei]|uniref:Uncharacterized protein n=1 Tax=Penaeus vannamei TaxID=6689 RepID=A0A3R7MFU4_PENVA|nr:hypothetical protein C7M84_006257 [Penaeus vannamei]
MTFIRPSPYYSFLRRHLERENPALALLKTPRLLQEVPPSLTHSPSWGFLSQGNICSLGFLRRHLERENPALALLKTPRLLQEVPPSLTHSPSWGFLSQGNICSLGSVSFRLPPSASGTFLRRHLERENPALALLKTPRLLQEVPPSLTHSPSWGFLSQGNICSLGPSASESERGQGGARVASSVGIWNVRTRPWHSSRRRAYYKNFLRRHLERENPALALLKTPRLLQEVPPSLTHSPGIFALLAPSASESERGQGGARVASSVGIWNVRNPALALPRRRAYYKKVPPSLTHSPSWGFLSQGNICSLGFLRRHLEREDPALALLKTPRLLQEVPPSLTHSPSWGFLSQGIFALLAPSASDFLRRHLEREDPALALLKTPRLLQEVPPSLTHSPSWGFLSQGNICSLGFLRRHLERENPALALLKTPRLLQEVPPSLTHSPSWGFLSQGNICSLGFLRRHLERENPALALLKTPRLLQEVPPSLTHSPSWGFLSQGNICSLGSVSFRVGEGAGRS